MSNILLINTRPTRNYDVLDIQPGVKDYFHALEKVGPKMGDTRTEPNNGLLIIGNCLLANKHKVEYLDINHLEYKNYLQTGDFFSLRKIILIIEQRSMNHDFLFFSSIITGIDDTLKIIDEISVRLPDKTIFLGGTFPSLEPDYCIKNSSGIDALIIGEGEDICNPLVESFRKKDFSKLENTHGLIYRKSKNESYINLPGHNVADIKALGPLAFPAWKLLSNELEPHVYRVMSSRGCGFHCSFCVPSHMSGHTVRNHNIEHIISSIKRIKNEFHADNYVIGDLTFLYDQKFGQELLERIILEKLDLPFWCQTHLSRITEKNISLLKKAGCAQLAIGIESISPSVLSNINKGINERVIVEKLQLIKKYGIEVQSYFIIGLPGDNNETVEINKHFIKYAVENQLIDRTHIGLYVPYPGTTIDSSITVSSNDYSLYTQGVFIDIPSKSVAGNGEMTSDEITVAYEKCLTIVGEALRNIKNLSTSPEAVVLGAEAISVIARIRAKAGSTRKAVINIVQGINQIPSPFVSANIFENDEYVVGSAEVYNSDEFEAILNVVYSSIDIVLIDAGIKSSESENIINCVKDYLPEDKIVWYSDIQAWLRTVQDMVLYLSTGKLIDKRILLAPSNSFIDRLKTQLDDFCGKVHIAGSENDKRISYDFLITYGELALGQIEKLLGMIKTGGYFIDSKICSVNDAIMKSAKRNNINVLRPDMRNHILSEVLIGMNYKDFVSRTIGKKEHDGVSIVSGGLLGEKDDIIVDSVNFPKTIIGVADGSGKTIPLNKLEQKHRIHFNKIKNLIESSDYDK